MQKAEEKCEDRIKIFFTPPKSKFKHMLLYKINTSKTKAT